VEANRRFAKLIQLEEAQDHVQQSMAEKSKLNKAMKDIESKIETKNEKDRFLENFLNNSSTNLASDGNNLQSLKDKVKNLQIK
jgi:siroheme synthase (precorrin-2 oxidase/ferrochelatase)